MAVWPSQNTALITIVGYVFSQMKAITSGNPGPKQRANFTAQPGFEPVTSCFAVLFTEQSPRP